MMSISEKILSGKLQSLPDLTPAATILPAIQQEYST